MATKSVPHIMITLDELLRGKSKLGHGTGDIRKVSIVKENPVVNSKELIINALANGTSLYTLTMNIFGCEYSDSKLPDYPLTVTLGQGVNKYMKQVPLKGTRVQVRCSCPDFYYTWSYWDHQTKTLAGPKPKTYIRKTTTYPERNPLHVAGVCKHLITLTEKLIGLRIIKV
jgi:hypothetical protein